MEDKEQPKQQPINELAELRQRIAELEKQEKERKRADEALQVSETRYWKLFETSQDGLLLLNKKTGRIINVNPAIVKLLGYSSEEFEGKELKDIGLMKDIEDFKKIIQILDEVGLVHYDLSPGETKEGKSNKAACGIAWGQDMGTE